MSEVIDYLKGFRVVYLNQKVISISRGEKKKKKPVPDAYHLEMRDFIACIYVAVHEKLNIMLTYQH